MTNRDQILAALSAFAHQRPGLEPRNYISDWRDTNGRRAYRQESRAITRDLHDFEALLANVALKSSITADDLRAGFRAYSGRLTLHEENGKTWLDYCTGQYFPTEYRRAACAVLGSVIFDYWVSVERANGTTAPGMAARLRAKHELGARLQNRWID